MTLPYDSSLRQIAPINASTAPQSDVSNSDGVSKQGEYTVRLGPQERRHLLFQQLLQHMLHEPAQRVLSVADCLLPRGEQILTIIPASHVGTSFQTGYEETWRC